MARLKPAKTDTNHEVKIVNTSIITSVVAAAILVIVAFALFPTLNGASNNLQQFFNNSCDDGNGNRFSKAYAVVTGSAVPGAQEYNTDTGKAGGSGANVNANGASCQFSAITTTAASGAHTIVNEYGNPIGSGTAASNAVPSADLASPNIWVAVPRMLQRFSGINSLLLGMLPVVSVLGFIGVSGARLYRSGTGAGGLGSAISGSIITLIAIVVLMVISGPIMNAAVDANGVIESGQYVVNNQFSSIILLLFGMFPVIFIAGIVGLVAQQVRSAVRA